MNYTERYHLPQWEETDRIMRTDFNQRVLRSRRRGAAAGLLRAGGGGPDLHQLLRPLASQGAGQAAADPPGLPGAWQAAHFSIRGMRFFFFRIRMGYTSGMICGLIVP